MKAASPSSTTSGCASGVAGAGADGGVGGATGGGGGGSEVGASGGRWLYLDGVATVRAVKWTAPFSETSPMLHALAMLPQWRQVRDESRGRSVCGGQSASLVGVVG